MRMLPGIGWAAIQGIQAIRMHNIVNVGFPSSLYIVIIKVAVIIIPVPGSANPNPVSPANAAVYPDLFAYRHINRQDDLLVSEFILLGDGNTFISHQQRILLFYII